MSREFCGQTLVTVDYDSQKAYGALLDFGDDNPDRDPLPGTECAYKMTIDELTSIADPKHISYDDFIIKDRSGYRLDKYDIEDAYYYDPDDPCGYEDDLDSW